MAWKSYRYTPQASRTSHVYSYRPLLQVEVGSGSTERSFMALVDSGTDVTMMDAEIATVLGITSEGKETGTASSVGGEKDGFLSEVTITVPGFEEKIVTVVCFVEGLVFDMILGQQDFFHRFNVMFKRHEKNFYLEVARTEDELT